MPPVRGRELKLNILVKESSCNWMPPVRGRELKPKGYGFTVDDIDWMPPVRGRELKHSVFQEDKVMYRDAPCAGARIETYTGNNKRNWTTGCPLCGGEN